VRALRGPRVSTQRTGVSTQRTGVSTQRTVYTRGWGAHVTQISAAEGAEYIMRTC
jgi:hypothetical protein